MRLIAAAGLILTACYPAFTRVTAPPILDDPSIGPNVRAYLASSNEVCIAHVNDARQAAYDAHKAQYQAGVFGSIVTLATGSGAGAFGAAEQQALSGVSGGLALVSGVVTLIAVNKPALDSAEKKQTELLAAWNAMVSARQVYELAIITNDAAKKKTAMEDLVKALQACGLNAPPPGLL